MGGRVYDPEIGRFLSPDPFVQYPGSAQGMNRYAYVGNNPLSFTDPSGYFRKTLKKIGMAVGFAMNFIPGMQFSNVLLHGFVSGFLVGGGRLKPGLMGMASAGLASRIGGIDGLNNLTRSALHGLAQGAVTRAGGGRFGDGALGAFAGSALSFIPERVAGPYGTGGEGAKIARMVAAATVGGTASAIGGGKFANGAWTAAFVSRFNHDGGLKTEGFFERIKARLADEFRQRVSVTAAVRGGLGFAGEVATTASHDVLADGEIQLRTGVGGGVGVSASLTVDIKLVSAGPAVSAPVTSHTTVCAGPGYGACGTIVFMDKRVMTVQISAGIVKGLSITNTLSHPARPRLLHNPAQAPLEENR